jgi:hypothetical protein
MTTVSINPHIWNAVSRHLSQANSEKEQAAFLFGRYEVHQRTIQIIDHQLMIDEDFAEQANDYLELHDATRAHLIKRAHAQHACLLEIHSHPGAYRAAFSSFDFLGLRETVPHMQWRLRNQPYVAIVVAGESLDALVWQASARDPSALRALNVGVRTLSPTNLSLERWKGIKNESV